MSKSKNNNDVIKALVIEPSRAYQIVLGQFLGQYGFINSSVQSAHEALEVIETESFDLICVAMHLPDILGIDFCRQIRKLPAPKCHTPVVMITYEEDSTLLTQALKAGATEIFKKTAIYNFANYLRQFVWNLNQRKNYHWQYTLC